MQITLKQPEIEQALKQYVSQKGFNLDGKSVAVDFTAGRKEAGLTADISIEDLPQLPAMEDEAAKTPLTLVASNEPAATAAPAEVAADQPAETPAKSLFS